MSSRFRSLYYVRNVAVEGGESDVTLVNVYTDHSISGVWFGHVELALLFV